MQAGAITGYIDVAQLTLYAFWLFFFGLIYWLRREDKREGYPLDSDHAGVIVQGFPAMPRPKTFRLAHGGVRMAPRVEVPTPVVGALPAFRSLGAPLVPQGDPLLAALGPAAYAARTDEVDLTFDSGLDKIVPLRVAREFSVAAEDPDPRGWEVIGADGRLAGTVAELWVDRSEIAFRFVEMTLPGGGGTVLVPITFVQFIAGKRLKVRAIRSDQFASIPAIRGPDRITNLEEDRIVGYFGGGQLYALPERMGPLL